MRELDAREGAALLLRAARLVHPLLGVQLLPRALPRQGHAALLSQLRCPRPWRRCLVTRSDLGWGLGALVGLLMAVVLAPV